MNKKQKKTFKKIILAIILLVFAVVLDKVVIHQIITGDEAPVIVALVIYLIPYITIGDRVIIKAAKNIKNGHIFDENFLMLLATVGAFILGEYTEAVAVMLFYQIGELFENIAVNKSRTAITSLVNLRPDYANIEKDGELKQVDPYDVAVGDCIIVLPGEKIPLDGVVVEGESFINTAALTGESVPRKASVGDMVLSGCINEQGKLTLHVEKEFDDSTVAKILDMVENATSRKSRSESFITRFARYYTPIVVVLALLVAFLVPVILGEGLSKWVGRALIFLVISCPCALVISVPLGFFGGIGAASKHGILVKGSNYLEMMAKVDTIVFDKTGTLTEGVFKVNKIVAIGDLKEEEIIRLAAYAECYSNHPIASSIMKHFSDMGKNVDISNIDDVVEISGRGIEVKLIEDDVINDYYVGNVRLLQKRHINVPEINDEFGTIVFVADKKKCLGYIVISDVIKDAAADAISNLKKTGINETIILTGDRKDAADKVAGTLGIDTVYSELLPDDKLNKLEEILEAGKNKVAFVGDGINDAPSLKRADVGIAMGAMGQDAAIEAADIVLMDDNPGKIAVVSDIGRKTLAIVKQNIVFALFVKILAMVLGVFGIANMWFAVFADVGVSVLAILNSMRMLRYRHTKTND